MRSAITEQSPQRPADLARSQRLRCAGQSYLERLGIVYMEQIRLTIVTELYMREMGIRQFYDTIGGSSYASVRRHFLKLAEHGWIRWVRNTTTGRGRPEGLYRSTELPVIDTETFRSLPISIRDALTVQLLEEMGARLGDSLASGVADARPDGPAVFGVIGGLSELDWCQAYDAVEECFQALLQEQTDAKIRLENKPEEGSSLIVNLGVFEAPKPASESRAHLPKATVQSPPPPWPDRMGKVFADRLDLAIVAELNQTSMTPSELRATLGGTSSQGFLRRCKRLADLGWAVNVNTQTGGHLHGASVYEFRAAAPNVSESEIAARIPATVRRGRSWSTFQAFLGASLEAVEAGTFNRRFDRHLTMSPMLLDDIGIRHVNKALLKFEETMKRIEVANGGTRREQPAESFPVAFLLHAFGAPARELRP